MKIAIIGAGPSGQFMASRFSEMGAYVCLFDGGDCGQTARFLGNSDLRSDFSGEVKRAQVTQVQKRFLGPSDVIENHSRLHDLFRVLYSVKPGEEIGTRMQENPEVFEKLGEEVLASLKKEVEAFMDVDLVIDTRGPFQTALGMGPGGAFALNERALRDDGSIFYGRAALDKWDSLRNCKVLTIIGSDILAMQAMLNLEPWLESGDHELNIISEDEECFASAYDSNLISEEHKKTARQFINKNIVDWKKKCEEKRLEIQQWRSLDNHERVKKAMPQMPEPKLKIYEGYHISSVDKLLDREGLFLTLELAPWRNIDKKRAEMMTLKQDALWVLNSFRQNKQVTSSLSGAEPGYYNVEDLKNNEKLETMNDIYDYIENDLAQYFSKANS